MGNNLVHLTSKSGLSDIISIMNNQGAVKKDPGAHHKGSCSFYVTYLCGISCAFLDSKGTGKLYCSTSTSKCGRFYLGTRT